MPENRRFLLNQQGKKKSASVRPSQPQFHKVKKHFCLQYHLPVTINNFCSDLWSLLPWEWAHLLPNVCKMCSVTRNWQHTATARELLHLSSIFPSLEMSAFQGQGHQQDWSLAKVLPQGPGTTETLALAPRISLQRRPRLSPRKNAIDALDFKTDVPNLLNIIKSWYLTHLYSHEEPSFQYCWT